MKIIAVDDEYLALRNITSLLEKVVPDAEVVGFLDIKDVYLYLSEQRVDIIFLDIELGQLSGIAFAKRCKDLFHQVNIIFVTAYSEFAMEALKLHASGYLMKPVREKDLLAEIHNLRYPLHHLTDKQVRIQTFGNFEIFVDGHPLKLSLSKCKECLAYLVDRKGVRVSMPELSSVLWEDSPYDRVAQNRLHQVIHTLKKDLKRLKISDILIAGRGEAAVDTDKFDCDYYQALNGDITSMNAFAGEYMSNYSWAEFTLGEWERKNRKRS